VFSCFILCLSSSFVLILLKTITTRNFTVQY
jgi:hypothetical protein